jgi:lipopolysaccharide/colanic/teichoic acid biosynthesis glycosyltransferase
MRKRAFDFVFAFFALLLIWPVLLIISACIIMDSGQPVFYRGVRTGLHGKPFRIYKFRSMIKNDGSTATAHNDPRITKVGRFIRRYKLDELPQLLNVIRGEMSIVGPRPEVEEHTRVYTDEEKIILSVRPGITDFSSIRFINLNELLGSEDPNRVFKEKYRDEKNRLRIKYVKERSFWVDMKIILTTVVHILKR